MNKKILSFSLISGILTSSGASIVKAVTEKEFKDLMQKYEEQSFFPAPSGSPVKKEIVVAIDRAVIAWNDLRKHVLDEAIYNEFYNVDTDDTAKKMEEKALILREKAEKVIEKEFGKKYAIVKPWDKIDKKSKVWELLFNLQENDNLDKEYNLQELYKEDKLKDNTKKGRLKADYQWYSRNIAFARAHLRKAEEKGEKNNIYWERELVLNFQAREWVLDEMDKLEEKEECKCLNPNDCNIF